MMKQAGSVALILGALALAPMAWAAEPITGRWVTQDKDAVVAIAPCGNALCGRIERFLVPPPEGNDQRDINNPDPAKRARKLLGSAILFGLAADGNGWRGQVYDPKKGKTYAAKLRRKPDGTLEMKGCIGPFCQSQVWKKAS